jgi:hypothetical protein
MARTAKPIPRRSHSAVAESACRSCGFMLGTNRGRCTTCFDAWADLRLTLYFDWMAGTIPGVGSPWRDGQIKQFQAKAAETLAEHGPLLIPR